MVRLTISGGGGVSPLGTSKLPNQRIFASILGSLYFISLSIASTERRVQQLFMPVKWNQKVRMFMTKYTAKMPQARRNRLWTVNRCSCNIFSRNGLSSRESRESRLLILILGVKVGESKPEVAKVDLLQVILLHQISELWLLHQERAIILMRHLNDNVDRGDDDDNEA